MEFTPEQDNSIHNEPQPVVIGKKKGTSAGLAWLLLLGVLFAILFVFTLMMPGAFGAFFTILRYILICVTSLFIILSILVFIGLKDEAKELLSQVINGSLSVLDLLREIRIALLRSLKLLFRFISRFIPIYTFILAGIIYYAILYMYKKVGIESDVTLLTIVLTAVMVFVVGMLSKPRAEGSDPNSLGNRFRRSFTDSFEVMLFIFFLTMDSTSLFFLPAELNSELHAQLGSYNLMEIGFHIDNTFGLTLNIILLTVAIEIARQGLRIYAYSKKFSKQLGQELNVTKETKLKLSLSRAVSENLDELMKFVIYFTVLLLVFLFFPRLKLLAMFVASFSSLLLDFIIPERLTAERQEDLIGRVISKLFRLQ